MNLKSLQKLCKVWQKRLQIQDYTIHLNLSANLEAGCMGRCCVWENKLAAEIEIATIERYEQLPLSISQEYTLVHELLHVVLPRTDLWKVCPDDSMEYKVYERGIDRMATALVEAYK